MLEEEEARGREVQARRGAISLLGTWAAVVVARMRAPPITVQVVMGAVVMGVKEVEEVMGALP